jgi:hypothetical protein
MQQMESQAAIAKQHEQRITTTRMKEITISTYARKRLQVIGNGWRTWIRSRGKASSHFTSHKSFRDSCHHVREQHAYNAITQQLFRVGQRFRFGVQQRPQNADVATGETSSTHNPNDKHKQTR